MASQSDATSPCDKFRYTVESLIDGNERLIERIEGNDPATTETIEAWLQIARDSYNHLIDAFNNSQSAAADEKTALLARIETLIEDHAQANLRDKADNEARLSALKTEFDNRVKTLTDEHNKAVQIVKTREQDQLRGLVFTHAKALEHESAQLRETQASHVRALVLNHQRVLDDRRIRAEEHLQALETEKDEQYQILWQRHTDDTKQLSDQLALCKTSLDTCRVEYKSLQLVSNEILSERNAMSYALTEAKVAESIARNRTTVVVNSHLATIEELKKQSVSQTELSRTRSSEFEATSIKLKAAEDANQALVTEKEQYRQDYVRLRKAYVHLELQDERRVVQIQADSERHETEMVMCQRNFSERLEEMKRELSEKDMKLIKLEESKVKEISLRDTRLRDLEMIQIRVASFRDLSKRWENELAETNDRILGNVEDVLHDAGAFEDKLVDLVEELDQRINLLEKSRRTHTLALQDLAADVRHNHANELASKVKDTELRLREELEGVKAKADLTLNSTKQEIQDLKIQLKTCLTGNKRRNSVVVKDVSDTAPEAKKTCRRSDTNNITLSTPVQSSICHVVVPQSQQIDYTSTPVNEHVPVLQQECTVIEAGSSRNKGKSKDYGGDFQISAQGDDNEDDSTLFQVVLNHEASVVLVPDSQEPEELLKSTDLDAVEGIRSKVETIWSMFIPAWDISAAEERTIKSQFTSIFARGKKSLKEIVQAIDMYIFGDSKQPLPYPNVCLIAKITRASHGLGGTDMCANNCKYCKTGKSRRICLWAEYVPGVDVGCSASRIDGEVSNSHLMEWKEPSQNLTVGFHSKNVRWILRKRKTYVREDDTIEWDF